MFEIKLKVFYISIDHDYDYLQNGINASMPEKSA